EQIHNKASLTYCELVLICTKISLHKNRVYQSAMINAVISVGKVIIYPPEISQHPAGSSLLSISLLPA
ncbi:hypothetical protein, partial [Morganella morganii]|uniref:hypothetical protein n=1 Tax=Morganella morganii TaxID=582 RepID=UPI00330675E1